MTKTRITLFAVVMASILAGYFGLQYIERKMQSDRKWMPPQIQIRKQSQMLGAERNASVIPDEDLGFRFPPYLTQEVRTLDFDKTRALDAKGFPNSIPWPEKADILFLGDSILMGEGVGVDNGLVALVNDRLSERIALNLSLPGAGMSRQNRLLARYGEDLNPDLIVVCLLISYDFLNDVHFNAWLDDSLGKTYGDFRLSYARRESRGASSHYMRKIQRRALYQWLLSRIEPLLAGDSKILHSETMGDGQNILFDRNRVKFAKRDFSESDPEIGQLGEALDTLRVLSDDLQSDLVVLLLPSKEELFAVSPKSRGNSLDLTKKLLAKRNIDHLDLYEVLESSALERTPYFSADIHLNEFGNEVVAETFLNWFQAR